MSFKFILVLCIGLFINVSAGASMVSFYFIETGLPDNGNENQHSLLWESAFMDVFFEAGYIVSNTPVLRLENKPQGDILRQVNMHTVRNAGIDFLLIAQFDFNSDMIPSEISFYIYKVNPREKLFERKIDVRAGRRPSREEFEYMKSVARGLVPYIAN